MAFEQKPVILKWDRDSGNLDTKEPSFDSVLNSACERLWDKHIQYSIRRIGEMEQELDELEKELDFLLRASNS